jgi:hypothetical protein
MLAVDVPMPVLKAIIQGQFRAIVLLGRTKCAASFFPAWPPDNLRRLRGLPRSLHCEFPDRPDSDWLGKKLEGVIAELRRLFSSHLAGLGQEDKFILEDAVCFLDGLKGLLLPLRHHHEHVISCRTGGFAYKAQSMCLPQKVLRHNVVELPPYSFPTHLRCQHVCWCVFVGLGLQGPVPRCHGLATRSVPSAVEVEQHT